MNFGTQLKKLYKKIKLEKKYKTKISNLIETGTLGGSKPTKTKEKVEKNLAEQLDFFKKMLRMIENVATGFDLAYEVEKNKVAKNLIYDGILFYNTFIEIGNTRFIDAPDKKKVDYKAFRTIEDTEKYVFMIWLKEIINSIEKEIKPREDFNKYKEIHKRIEIKEAQKKIRKNLIYCKNCGERIRSEEQEFCEKCGMKFLENL
ncbi:hypothetical protein LCGC14_0979230 [marine sediment metagenome]|uniref:Zinc-ribbon domain-containing protein n=1 Tax=marine sediment metagenome TaxID=412755 RepID=A0A0F9NVI2_9ZZZZ|nr:zinc ribbon domain-containing protein [archaeon]